VNVEGTRNVVDVCLALGIPKIIHVSSIAALGRQKGTLTVDEESKWIDNTAGSYYAESKYQAEAEIFRGQEEGLSVSMVIPSAILGPSDWTKSSSQVFRYVWRRGSFYTEGTFNYVDVRDVADMIFELFQGDYAGQKFIATAGSTSLKNLLEEIALRFNKKAPSIKLNGFWVWTISRLEAIRSLLLGTEPLITRESAKFALESFQYSNQKAKDVLRFKFRTIEETLDWCCTEYLHNINTKK
jgi:dihydroflavonol-4-reductase